MSHASLLHSDHPFLPEDDLWLQDGSTPLHLATWKGHVDTVKLLVEQGASFTVCPSLP